MWARCRRQHGCVVCNKGRLAELACRRGDGVTWSILLDSEAKVIPIHTSPGGFENLTLLGQCVTEAVHCRRGRLRLMGNGMFGCGLGRCNVRQDGNSASKVRSGGITCGEVI